MKKVKVFLVLCLLLSIVMNTNSVVFAAAPSYSYFRYDLSGDQAYTVYKKTATKSSSTAISGTWIKGKMSVYANFYAYQKAVLGSGTETVSPSTMVASSEKTWLGFYTGYSSVANKNIYLYTKSFSASNTDTFNSGYWWR